RRQHVAADDGRSQQFEAVAAVREADGVAARLAIGRPAPADAPTVDHRHAALRRDAHATRRVVPPVADQQVAVVAAAPAGDLALILERGRGREHGTRAARATRAPDGRRSALAAAAADDLAE